MDLVVHVLVGAIAAVVSGVLLKRFSNGAVWNGVVGALGGALGGSIVTEGLRQSGAQFDAANPVALAAVAAAALFGAILATAIGVVRRIIAPDASSTRRRR